jgi:HlyD family secretion protein
MGAIALLAVTAAYVQLSPTPAYTSSAAGQPPKTGAAGQALATPVAEPREHVVTARLGTIADTIALNGRIGAADELPLSFPAPQRIAAVNVSPGDDVEAGQVIVEADRAELARALGAARERLTAATAKLRQAEDTTGRQTRRTELRQTITAARTQRSVADAEALLRQAEADYQRIQQGATPAERRAAEVAVTAARAAYARAEADAAKLREGTDDLEYRQADQQVLQAQMALQKAQDDYQRLASGPGEEQLRTAEREYLAAQNGLSRAQADVQRLVQPDPMALAAADREVDRARSALRVAEIAAASPINSATGQAGSSRALQAERQAAVLNARIALQSANERQQAARAGAPQTEVMMARRNLTAAESALDSARDRLDAARRGPDSFTMTQAQLSVETARLAFESATARLAKLGFGPAGEQVNAVFSALQSAETALRGAEAQQAELLARPTETELAAAEEQLRRARDTLAQARAEADVPPDESVDQTMANLIVVQQQVVDQEQAAIQALENDLMNAQVVAPFAGRVVALGVRAKDGVDAGRPVAVIARRDATPIVLADVPVGDGARLAVGQDARLRYGGAATGEDSAQVSEVSTVSGLVRVTLQPALMSRLPALGSPLSVTVVAEQRENVVLVPESALRGSGRVRVVDVVTNGERRQVEVTVGLIAGGDAEIRSGLSEGDQVVVAP